MSYWVVRHINGFVGVRHFETKEAAETAAAVMNAIEGHSNWEVKEIRKCP